MKRSTGMMVLFLLLIIGMLTSACGNNAGVTMEEYEALLAENEKLEEQVRDLRQANERKQQECDSLEATLEEVQQEFDSYKEIMKEYEELGAAEAEARRIEAQRIIDEQRAEEERQAAEEAARKEAEEKAGYETGITYSQLARTPDDYEGDKVMFKGTVLQIIEDSEHDYIHMRLAVGGDYDQILYCEYKKDIVPERILEDDVVTIYGISYGLHTYQSTIGSQITIPAVVIDKIDQ